MKKPSYLISALFLSFLAFAPSVPEAQAAESLVIQQYRKALELDPENVSINYKIGVALLREKDFSEALKHLSAVYSSAASEDQEILYYLGIAYSGIGELEKAFESFERFEGSGAAVPTAYELDKLYYNLGISYYKKDSLEPALRALEKSIDIDPKQGLAYCRKGEVLFELRRYSDALESFNTCEKRMPGDARVKRNISSTRLARGLSLVSERKYIEALEDFKAITSNEPNNETALYFQGFLYYQLSEFKLALEALTAISTPESRDIYENMPLLLQNVGIEFHEKEDWQWAEQAFKKALELKKRDPDLHYLLGFTYMKKGEYGKSLEEMKETIRLNPQHPKANLLMALVTERLIGQLLRKSEQEASKGEYTEALQTYNEVLSIDPVNRTGLQKKMELEAVLKQKRNEASKMKEKELSSRFAVIEKLIGDEKYKEALATYRYILALDPGNERALRGIEAAEYFMKEKKDRHARKGDQYAQGSNPSLALMEYRKALEYDQDDASLQARAASAEKEVASNASPYFEKAAQFEAAGRFTESLNAYGEVLKFDPENQDALNGKARSIKALEGRFNRYVTKATDLIEDGDYSRAAENFKAAMGLVPEDPDVRKEFSRLSASLKGVALQRMKAADRALKDGKFSEAAANYEVVIAIDDSDQEARDGLKNARSYVNENLSRKSQAADQAYHEGRYTQAYQLYTEILQIDKDNRNARTMRESARQKNDETINALNRKGVEAYNRADEEAAAASFRKVLSSDASNQTAKKYLSMLDKPREKKPNGRDMEKLYLKGIELYTEGKYLDAIKAWEGVLSQDPRHQKAALNIEKAKRKLEGVMDVK